MAAKTRVRLEVLRTEELTDSLRRVVLGGPGLEEYFPFHRDETDVYVKLVFDGPDGELRRTYTVRHVDPLAREMWIDFVLHGDRGVAGPWAAAVRPGDTIQLDGPGGGYRPDPAADHHLFVGDEAALPAVASSLATLPAGSRATAFLEVDGPGDELEFETDAALTLNWLHRGEAEAGTTNLLDDAVRGWSWPDGRVQAFVHGESAILKTVRPYLLDGKVDRTDISVSAYWRRGVDEMGFREWKKTQNEAVMRPEVKGS